MLRGKEVLWERDCCGGEDCRRERSCGGRSPTAEGAPGAKEGKRKDEVSEILLVTRA